MGRGRLLLTIACLAAAALLGGCAGASGGAGGSATLARKDRAGQALSLALAQMQAVAPDAVPIVIGSAGVATNPPPEEWQILLASRATGRMYSVSTSQNKAEKPRDMGTVDLSSDTLANVIPYDALKVNSDQAYEKARAELAKTGNVPPQATESITLVEMPSLPDAKPAVWQVSFLNGSSSDSTRQVDVDAMTGAVTVTK
jgi:Peptidase propeptide and YPEB domain